MKLRLAVPFHPDETVASYASRLAARNGVKARRLCLDFGLRFQAVVDGDEGTLRSISRLGGIDPEVLLANAFLKSGEREWTHRGHVLHRAVLRRERIAICPACAQADIEASPQLRPAAAVYGRVPWLIDAVRTCPVHRSPLVLVSEDLSPQHLHDFAAHVANTLPRLADLAATAPARDLGPLEVYVLARLDGRTASSLLDPMPLAAAVRLCETAGAVALFGPKVDLKILSDADRLAAGGRGCEDLAGGEPDLRKLLERMHADVGGRARQDGPSVAFGRLYTLLSTTSADPAYRHVRNIVRQYVQEHFALEADQPVFGEPLGRRTVHSLHTLAAETAIHPKRLRKHLRAAGLINDAQMAMSDHNIRIDAEQAADIAKALADTLSLAEAIGHLNAPRAQMDVLIKAGFVQPQRQVTGFGAQDRYAVVDLDAFLARLKRKIGPVGQKRLDNIPNAARKACCSAAEVVQLIIDGRLRTAQAKRSGYLGVVVDPRDVAKAVRGPKNDGVPLRKVATLLGTHDGVVASLIAGGHLASYRGVNSINRCPQTLVAPKEIKRFKATYISLHALARERKLFIGTMKSTLDAAGIRPAFDPKEVGATFYRRSDVRDGGQLD